MYCESLSVGRFAGKRKLEILSLPKWTKIATSLVFIYKIKNWMEREN